MNARVPNNRNRTRRILACAVEPLEARQLLTVTALDTLFGVGGKTVTDFNGQPNSAYSVALADGKILVAGSLTTNGDADFALARYNADGTLDTTFGNGGIITTDFGSAADEAYAMSVEVINASTYKIVLAGTTQTASGYFDFAVARYNADGSPDSGFGANHDGKVVVDFAHDFDRATAIAFQSGGKILITGSATVAFNSEFGMLRLNDDGSLDTSFGANHTGKVLNDWGGALSESAAVAVQGDGKIVIAGYAYDYGTGDADAAVARYTADGLLDTSFGVAQSGMVKIDFGQIDDRAQAVTVQADGSILLAGYANDFNGNSDFVLTRLTSGGQVDTTFGPAGMNGIVLTDFGGMDQAYALAVQADGKIVVGGHSGEDCAHDFAVARFTSDGMLDADFGPGGKIVTDMGQDDTVVGLAIDSAGGVIAAGSSVIIQAGAADFALARFAEPLPPPPPPPPPVNVAPVADAGGPYVVLEGSALRLLGGKSMDPDGTIISYEWDFDYDGSSFNADATGKEVDFPKLNGPAFRTVALRVTDDQGASTIITTTVQVNNAPPVAALTGPTVIKFKQLANFTGSFFDPGLLDTHQVSWDFGDGSVVDFKPGEDPSALIASHVYAKKGAYMVTFTVRDSDGAVSSATLKVEVQAGHVTTSTAAGLTTLTVTGTDAADGISVKKAKRGGGLEITVNGVAEGLFQGDRLIVYGSSGNDHIRIGDGVTQPVEVFGQDGNDVIEAGMGDATLHGGGGNDKLFGGTGKNVLDGGAGNDLLQVPEHNKNAATLMGGAGKDVLIGGAGNDLLDGGDGDDHLLGRRGTDRLMGGSGKDHYDAVKAGDVVSDPDIKPAPVKSKKSK